MKKILIGLMMLALFSLSAFAGATLFDDITMTGSVTAGAWEGTAVGIAYGGTGAASASLARIALGLAIGTDVQAYDAALATIAGITLSADIQSFLAVATYDAGRTALGLAIGTNTQAYDEDLDYLATFTPTADVKTILNAADATAITTVLSLTIGTNTQAYDADLAALAGVTSAANVIPYFTASETADVISSSANVISFLGSATYLAMTQAMSVEIGVDTEAWDADLDTYAGITPTATAQLALEYANYSVVLNVRKRVSIAQVNAGYEILPAIAGRTYRMIQCQAIAYGGAVGTVTTVDLEATQSAGPVKLVAFAQANLTQSAVLVSGGTGAAVTADGASYIACDAATAITVGITGGDAVTATGIDFILTYVIE